MTYLLVEDEPTVELTGSLDANERLQLAHTSGNLLDHGDALEAQDPGKTIRVKLLDFMHGASSWAINASHVGPAGPINWNRSSDHAYYDFSEYMANFLEVTVTANNGGQPKEKVIEVRTKPDGSLPDRDP